MYLGANVSLGGVSRLGVSYVTACTSSGFSPLVYARNTHPISLTIGHCTYKKGCALANNVCALCVLRAHIGEKPELVQAVKCFVSALQSALPLRHAQSCYTPSPKCDYEQEMVG